MVLHDAGRGPLLDVSTGPPTGRPPDVELSHVPAWWAGLRLRPVPTLVVVFHHALVDPWSLALVLGEIGLIYRSLRSGIPATLPPVVGDYRDHVALMRDRSAHPDPDSIAYWRKELARAPTLPPPSVALLPAGSPTYGGSVRTDLSSVRPSIRRLARQRKVTPFTILLAVCGRVMQEFAGVEAILVAVPVVSRETPDAARTVGCFTDMSLIRVGDAGLSLAALVDSTFRRLADMLDHQIPYQAILTGCAPTRLGGRPVGHDFCTVTLYPAHPPGSDGLNWPRRDACRAVRVRGGSRSVGDGFAPQ